MLLAAAAGVSASVAVLAFAHIDDQHNVGWSEGTRMALARSTNHGELVPPLFQDGHFGGTRYMPLPTIFHAGLARLTGEYLTAGKLASAAAMSAVVALVYLLAERSSCGRPLAAAAAASVLTTVPGSWAATSIGGDAIPLALQLAAVLVVLRSTSDRALLGAGALCGLGVLAKASALWGPAGIGVWLLINHRRRVARFAMAFAAVAVGGGLALDVLSHGRLLENLRETLFAGSGDLAHAPERSLLLLTAAGSLGVSLVAFAGVSLLTGWRRLDLRTLCLLMATFQLVVVASDDGTLVNHVLDLVALLALVAVTVVGAATAEVRKVLHVAVAAALLWGMGSYAVTELRPALAAARDDLGSSRPIALRGELPEGQLLAENPAVVVARDEDPVVLDAWMVFHLGQRHPEWIADLTGRIRDHEFAAVVLVEPVEDEDWYGSLSLGTQVTDAIADAYRLDRQAEGYYIYLPER